MNRTAAADLITEDFEEEKPKKRGFGRRRREGAEEKVKGKRSGLIKVLILLVLVIAAAVFLYASLRFNLGGVRHKLIERVNTLDPEYVALMHTERMVAGRERQVSLAEEEILRKQQTLDDRTFMLDEREAALRREEAARTPVMRAQLTESQIDEMRVLGRIYDNMDAKTAAGILAELYTTQDIAAILYYMNRAKAADVLASFDVRLAAAITEVLLYG